MAKKLVLRPDEVRRIRRRLGITQAEFAMRLSVDPITVARWEIGQRKCAGVYALAVSRLDPDHLPLFNEEAKKSTMDKSHTIIALFNHKGGVSKTTTAYNLGWTLSKLGKRVLMIDADPQCNLTGMTLSFAGAEDFETLYNNNPEANLFGALRPAFESMPERIKAVECFEVPGRPGLFLLPGHVEVASYDVPLGVAHELSGSLGVMRNLPGAISELLRACATSLEADYVLVDMSPAISSLNQNLFMTSTHFIVPCSPDYFCALAIDSLSKVLPRWAKWPERAIESKLFEGAAYPIPSHRPLFLGTINQRFRPRYGGPAKAFQHWIDRINVQVKNLMVPVLKQNGMMLAEGAYSAAIVNASPYSLANISDFNSLIARSQEANVPIFELTEEQLKVGGKALKNTKKSRDEFAALFETLAQSIIDLTTAPGAALAS